MVYVWNLETIKMSKITVGGDFIFVTKILFLSWKYREQKNQNFSEKIRGF